MDVRRLGRLTTDTNSLDTFTYGYNDATARVSQVSTTQGPTTSALYYTPQQRDRLLNSLTYTFSNEQLAAYTYAMDSRYNVTKFTEDDTFPTTIRMLICEGAKHAGDDDKNRDPDR